MSWIHSIETVAPPNAYAQEYACEQLAGWSTDRDDKRLARLLNKKSAINTRYSVIAEYDTGTEDSFFARDEAGQLIQPTTSQRNARYCRASVPLVCEATDKVFAATSSFSPQSVTHLITVSCTGFFNPGPDYHIVRNCGLSDSVKRYHVGFMGCYASMPALDMAREFCRSDENAVVLVVSVELCSLHLRVNAGQDALVANTLFSDGAAACLVSARPPRADASALRLGPRVSKLMADSEDDMAWTVGDEGFEMILSASVPKIIGGNAHQLISGILASEGLGIDDVDWWALHPGGRAVVDVVEKALALQPAQLAPSRAILRDYGNMSSATILFVLRELLVAARDDAREKVCAIAFGPGLTVEVNRMGLYGPGADKTTSLICPQA